MYVVEIFDSIDGEGLHAGGLATFIRFAGCNMTCRYCDTKYSWHGGNQMSISDIAHKIEEYGNRHVTITGGEPLIQMGVTNLIHVLSCKGYIVNVETNGSVDVMPFRAKDNCSFTVDYKLPSAGKREHAMMDAKLWDELTEKDTIKFVCNKDDFPAVLDALTHPTKAQILISPIFGEVELKDLVELLRAIKGKGLNVDARLQVQLHKLIWEPDARGV